MGLSAARLSALSVIVFGGPIRISALARAEQVKTPTMTPVAAALARAGLITRKADATDGRAMILRATPKGAKLMAEARARRVENLAGALRPLPAAERAVLREAAAILQRAFGARPARRP